MPNYKSATEKSGCIRCGTCCKKGGPSLHHEDKPLVEKGFILSKCLYTIRKGEMAYDNVKQRMTPATTDIIKIKGHNGILTCTFFDEQNGLCTIYDHRPLECRALKCWNTGEIEAIYDKNRLTRKDLVSEIAGLWELLADHQARCSYNDIYRLLKRLDTDQKDDALENILSIIQYDTQIRHLVVQKGGLDPAMIDFLFGRPVAETMVTVGFKIEKRGATYCLQPIATARNL